MPVPFVRNGHNGSIKGHVFDPGDPSSLPHYMQRLPQMQRERLAARETERYRLVGSCERCGDALIAEEVTAHLLSHENGRVRSLVGTFLQHAPEDRTRALEVIQELNR